MDITVYTQSYPQVLWVTDEQFVYTNKYGFFFVCRN